MRTEDESKIEREKSKAKQKKNQYLGKIALTGKWLKRDWWVGCSKRLLEAGLPDNQLKGTCLS